MGYILNYSNWRRIFEAEDPTLSNVKSKMAFAGATSSVTTNTNALAEFKAGLPSYTIDGEISGTTALIKINVEGGRTISRWKIGPKTQTAKNYLKVGDVMINGDSGKLVTMTVTADDLMTKSVEACGNGIFALGRAIIAKNSVKITGEGKIVIGLNTKTANAFTANADTAFQTPVVDFALGGMKTFIACGATIPNSGNESSNVTNAVDVKNGKTTKIVASDYPNLSAMPSLGNAYFDTLKEVSKIDATTFVETVKNKGITSYTTELGGYVKTYTDTFFASFLTAYAERFKTFLKTKATEAGIDSSLFSDLMTYIDEWKTTQSGLKETYKSEMVTRLSDSFKAIKYGPGAGEAPASAAGSVIKGTEGKIGQ